MTKEIFDLALEQITNKYPNVKILEAVQPLSEEDFYLQYNKHVSKCSYGGAIGIVANPNNRIVLTKRSGMHAGWALPGGTVENGEDFRTAFEREIKEEIGVDLYDTCLAMVEKKQFISPKGDRLNFILAVFLANIKELELPSITEEAKAEGLTVAMFDPDKIPSEMILGDKKKIEIYLRKIRTGPCQNKLFGQRHHL